MAVFAVTAAAHFPKRRCSRLDVRRLEAVIAAAPMATASPVVVSPTATLARGA